MSGTPIRISSLLIRRPASSVLMGELSPQRRQGRTSDSRATPDPPTCSALAYFGLVAMPKQIRMFRAMRHRAIICKTAENFLSSYGPDRPSMLLRQASAVTATTQRINLAAAGASPVLNCSVTVATTSCLSTLVNGCGYHHVGWLQELSIGCAAPGRTQLARRGSRGTCCPAGTGQRWFSTGTEGLMASRGASGAVKLTRLAVGISLGVATGNPLPAVIGAIDFVGWVYDVWHESSQQSAPSQKPRRTVQAILDSAMEHQEPGAFASVVRSDSPAASGQSAWVAQKTLGDQAAVQARARTIARSSRGGSEFDHWLQASVELQIAKRAEELSRSPQGRGELDNWLQAERELRIAQRAREIADSVAAASDRDNWLRAEREVLTRSRAAEIAKSPQAGSDTDNWLQAEREVLLTQQVSQRALEISGSPEARGDVDNWLRAEREVLTEYWTAEIARSPQAGSAAENQRRARREVLIVLRAREIASSPGAGGDLDNWLRAERELIARGVIKP